MRLGNRVLLSGAVLLVLLGGIWAVMGRLAQEKNDAYRKQLKIEAESINADFLRIRHAVERLAVRIADLYEDNARAEALAKADRSKYQLAPNGVFYKPVNDGGSALFVSGHVPVDDKVKESVYLTEPLDGIFKRIVNKYPEAVQVYYNDKNSLNRIYPFFDVLTQYEPKMDIPSFNFYYLADEKHNPKRGGVWVNEPYVDPAGRGWMVSAIAPVYINGALEGVPGIDVTIATITDRYMAQSHANLMIIDSAGVVVATQDYMANLFSLPPLIEHKYLETVKSDTYHVEYYNLLKNRSRAVRDMAQKIFQDKQTTVMFRSGTGQVLIMAEPIEELNWVMLQAVEK